MRVLNSWSISSVYSTIGLPPRTKRSRWSTWGRMERDMDAIFSCVSAWSSCWWHGQIGLRPSGYKAIDRCMRRYSGATVRSTARRGEESLFLEQKRTVQNILQCNCNKCDDASALWFRENSREVARATICTCLPVKARCRQYQHGSHVGVGCMQR